MNKTLRATPFKLFLVVAVLVAAVLCAVFSIKTPPAQPKKKFNSQLYRDLLCALQRNNYTLVTARDSLKAGSTVKIAILGHDVDQKTCGVETFRQVEKDFGVRSTFYVRPHAEYFQQSIVYFRQLECEGFEIGLHYECYSRIGSLPLAKELLTAQIRYMRSFFNVTTIRGHGDRFNQSLLNRLVYEVNTPHFNSMEAYEVIHRDTYIRDTKFQLDIPPETEWGRVVYLNFHSDWW